MWRWRIGVQYSRAPFWGVFSFIACLFLAFNFAFVVRQDALEFDRARFQAEATRAWESLESSIEHHESALRLLQSRVEMMLERDFTDMATDWERVITRLAIPVNYRGWAQLGYAAAVGEQNIRPDDGNFPSGRTGLAPQTVKIQVTLSTNFVPIPSLLGVNLNNLADSRVAPDIRKGIIENEKWRTNAFAELVLQQMTH